MPDFTDRIHHIVVLMLENRSFDHMLAGTTFVSPVKQATVNDSNMGIDSKPVHVSFDASAGIDAGPDHGHLGVMWQLTGIKPPKKPPFFKKPYNVTNSGFIASFEDEAAKHKPAVKNYGAHIMRCQPEQNVPVLSTLAKKFAVCDQWFCSVPGQTWPNRNYVHAGTSDGTDNITKRWYNNPTIFGTIINAKRNYRIYTDGIPECLVFRDLWLDKLFRGKFRDYNDRFAKDVAANDLPEYVFIEPNHFGKNANSQHPDNPANARSFHAGEALIKSVYDALASNPTIWASTLFILTYDEHGGFYDHERPPQDDVAPPDKKVSPEGFEFDMLGVRVPTVLVSPWIREGSVDSTIYDHSSIPHSVRELFAPDAEPLTKREAVSNTVWNADIWLDEVRDDVPQVEVAPLGIELLKTVKPVALLAAENAHEDTVISGDLPEHEEPWAWLAFSVAETIRREEQGQNVTLAMASWEDTTGRLITKASELEARRFKVTEAAVSGAGPVVLTDSDKLAAFGKDVQRMLQLTATPAEEDMAEPVDIG
ncbi:MAG TPA: alkaline phosphatase family protein [Thermoanaerobaculia bacterium]|jgi:phospholipase C|nr:alkaline phosphatase family protein [Thermoanaerobaculia bacterium]